jgi:hypothetical protein
LEFWLEGNRGISARNRGQEERRHPICRAALSRVRGNPRNPARHLAADAALDHSQGLALEALEEAGVSGEIEKIAIGQFQYLKEIKRGANVRCKVDVFPLKVTRERKSWAEKDGRERRWCTVTEAAASVDEPQLRLLIAKFGTRMAAAKQR